MATKYAELRAQMSPESQARSRARAASRLVSFRVGCIAVPTAEAWENLGFTGFPEAFEVGGVDERFVYDKMANRQYEFAEVVNITSNPLVEERVKEDYVVIPSLQAWVGQGYSGLPVANRAREVGPFIWFSKDGCGSKWGYRDLHILRRPVNGVREGL